MPPSLNIASFWFWSADLDPPEVGMPLYHRQHHFVFIVITLSNLSFPNLFCPPEKLEMDKITVRSPLVCSLGASEAFSSKFKPWCFICSPSHSLRTSMGRARRAECPIFILWKAFLCREALGGFDSFGDSPGTQNQMPSTSFAYVWKKGHSGIQASSQICT